MTRKTDPWHPDNIRRGMEEVARKRTGCAHCDAGRKIIYLPNDPEALPWHNNGGEKLHPCVATIQPI